MTVPESSIVRPSANGESLTVSKLFLNNWPGKIVARYCSPTKKFAPIPVNKVAKIMARWVLRCDTIGCMTAFKIPKPLNRPPSPKANIIIMIVDIIAAMPPRLSKAINVGLVLVVLKPLTTKSASSGTLCCHKKAALVTKILSINAGMAGTLYQAVTTSKPNGTSAHHVGCSKGNKAAIFWVACASARYPALKTTLTINVTPQAGTVVHIKFLMWAKRSVPEMALAKFVDSDKGELLSPKIAPDKTIPATIAGFIPINVPTPINETPTVDKVVKALPIKAPTSEVVTNAVGKKNAGVKILKPAQIIVGITPVASHSAIKAPISKKRNNGVSPDSIPFTSSR